MPKISVVIGTLGRTILLEKTLQHLLKQKFSPTHFEIIIVTNGKPPEIRSMLSRIPKKKNPVIKTIFCDFQWVAPKRNIGIRHACNPIVAFIDDDCLATPDWLKVISDFFDSNPKIVGIEGQTKKNATGLFEHAAENITGGLFPTCNLAFRRNILLKIHGFDETYTYHREDTDLAFKALAFGGIPFCPDMKVFHVTRPTNWKSVIKEIRWVRGDVRFFKKFPIQYLKSFGWPAQGALKQGALAWALVGAFIFGILQNVFFSILAILIFLFIKCFFVLRGKTWSLAQAIVFLAASLIRDLLFIPAVVFYAFTISGTEKPEQNQGWQTALKFQSEAV